MPDFADAKHRPHAVHTGETPQNPITYGPESLMVTLDRWGPTNDLFTSMYDSLQANWGDEPSRTVWRDSPWGSTDPRCDARVSNADMSFATGWYKLTDNERDYVESCFAGKTLQQVLEGVTFDFCISGVSRAFTHQNVRTRLGAGFMQHGGRDNDWRHRPWTMPETMRRMCEMDGKGTAQGPGDLRHCITDWTPFDYFVNNELRDVLSNDGPSTISGMKEAIEQHIMRCRRLYAALVDAGIPWQDARRVLPIGMQTYIHDQYNYLALQGVLANRLEHIMDWEFNCVAQLMLREIKMKCPPLLSKYLGSHSDRAGVAKFAALESWPPDGKYQSKYEMCGTCQHPVSSHTPTDWSNEMTCLDCERFNQEQRRIGHRVHSDPPLLAPMHKYVAVDSLPRQHRPEQNPFFVLHPDSMAGGPIKWIPTNGKYPHEAL